MAITNPNDMAIDKNAFYAKYAQVAIEQQIKYGIPASITLAQMGFESTFVLAETALKDASYTLSDARFSRETSYGAAWEFLEKQQKCQMPSKKQLKKLRKT